MSRPADVPQRPEVFNRARDEIVPSDVLVEREMLAAIPRADQHGWPASP